MNHEWLTSCYLIPFSYALYHSKREGRNRFTAVDLAEVTEESKRWT